MRANHLLSAIALAVIAVALVKPSIANAGEPTAAELLARATAILAPDEFTAQITFTTYKPNKQAKAFTIQMWKKGSDKVRFKFQAPADDRDMEVLRVGDNIWNYLPNLKRSLRISPKSEFHGGDFSNSDVLRVDLAQDYTPVLQPTAVAAERLIELTAKNDQVAYYKVKYWVRAKDAMPLRQEFYSKAGKLVRTLEFVAPKMFGKLTRPSKYLMQNMLVKSRSTEMEWKSMSVAKLTDDSLFAQANLGR